MAETGAQDNRLQPIGHGLPARRVCRDHDILDLGLAGTEIFSLRACWRVLSRRRGTILGVAAVATMLAAIYSFRTKPVYRATARVEVEADVPTLQDINELDQTVPIDDAYLQTQADILKSDNLAWQTIQQFHLEKSGEFHRAAPLSEEASLRAARGVRSQLLTAFKSHLDVGQEKGSRVIEVSFESTDPALAANISNALVHHYLEYNFLAKYDATRQVTGWMEQQLDELKAKVEKSQQALVDYEKENSITDLSDRENLIQARLADLSKDFTAAATERATKEALYNAVKKNPSAAGLLTKDDLLGHLQGQDADLKTNYVSAMAQYGPNFYKVVQIRKQIDELEALMQQEQGREEAQVEADYKAAAQRERILAGAVSQQRKEVQKLNELLIPYNILKNEYETNQQLYQSLLKRLKNATISAGLRATNIHVLDEAVVPASPIRPKKVLDITLGLLVGLILGTTLAFVQDALDTSVRNAEDLAGTLGVPVLGVIPRANTLPGVSKWLARREAGTPAAVEWTVVKQPSSALAEAYRALRTSILLSSAPRPPQILLVTSAQPNEGKSSICLNLAFSLAQLNKRVLLIDTDLRQRRLEKVLNLSQDKGLIDFLTGHANLEEILLPVEGVPNLWVLPAGPRPPAPADLLSSPTMEQVLSDLRQRFEFLVLDSPPLLIVTDATVLSKFVDGIILVTESELTARNAISRAQQILENAGARILGTVMNKLDAKRDGYDGYYYYYHRYYRDEPAATPAGSSSTGDDPAT
jgi:polysaccharide biosynthesis transport protein